MNIVILDYKTLGDDLDLSGASKFGTVTAYPVTSQEDAPGRIKNADIIIVNKVKMNESVLKDAKNLKLICETATGYDNIDISYCKTHGIAVANTPAYSTSCVAQVTVSMACALMTHLHEYRKFVHDGKYQKSISANMLEPIYHEMDGLTWGIIGFGNIGRGVGKIAEAFGCKVIVNKRSPVEDYECVPLETLLSKQNTGFEITVEDDVYIVEAPWLIRIICHTDLDDYESLQYFQRVLTSSGIIDALREKGINEGDTVSIYDIEFDFVN